KGKGGKDRRRAGPASVEGLSLRLRDLSFDPKAGSLVHALSANGGLEVENVTFESTHIRKARGQLRLGEGRFEVQELRFATEQGSFLARLLVDFNRLPFGYALTLLGEPLDVNAMVGATGAGGFGPGRLELEAEGFGSDSRNMKGKGVLRMDAGRLPSTPMLVSIEKSLGRTALVGSPYRAMENAFRIRNNRVFLDQFELEAEQVAIDLDGWVSLDGPLNLRLVVRTPRQGLKIKEVDDHVLDALTTDKGWVAIPFKVTGTMEEPRLRPDSRALMAQAGQGTRRLMKKKATEGIKSLFRRKLP
ncbi:MAG: AsmA-like C-terminal region-containing protein, partial [Acidobacteriota bacterium]